MLPARPTVAPVLEEPIFVRARTVSTALTATPLTLSAPVSRPLPCVRNVKNIRCRVSLEKSGGVEATYGKLWVPRNKQIRAVCFALCTYLVALITKKKKL